MLQATFFCLFFLLFSLRLSALFYRSLRRVTTMRNRNFCLPQARVRPRARRSSVGAFELLAAYVTAKKKKNEPQRLFARVKIGERARARLLLAFSASSAAIQTIKRAYKETRLQSASNFLIVFFVQITQSMNFGLLFFILVTSFSGQRSSERASNERAVRTARLANCAPKRRQR